MPDCEVCGKPIAEDLIPYAATRRGRYVCGFCRGPRVTVPAYALGMCLGEGTASAVFHARRTGEGPGPADVAIKVLKLHRSSRQDLERFHAQADKLMAVDHPNLVRILGHGTAGSTIYLVMELLKRDTLRTAIDRDGPLPVPFVVDVGRQAALGLDAAWTQAGLRHQDLKPSEILIGSGRVKVAGLVAQPIPLSDPGVARVGGGGEGIGTLPYMAPEQIEDAQTADHRADVYALGASLYHALTGKKPFTARSNMDFFMKIMSEEPTPILELRPEVPAVVAAIVARCMKRKREERYQSTREVAAALGFLTAL